MAESMSAARSRQRKAKQGAREGTVIAGEARFLNRQGLAERKGPLVVEVFLPVLSGPAPEGDIPRAPKIAIELLKTVPVDDAELRGLYRQTAEVLDAWVRTTGEYGGVDNRPRLLMRRPNLLTMVGAGVLPEPITAMVRQLMLYGPAAVETDHSRELYDEMILGLMRATIIVPPAGVEGGELAVEDITADQCRPLFVAPGEAPDDDQFVLVGPTWDAGAPGEVDPETAFQMFQVDLASFLMQLMVARQGAAAHFRRPSTEQADAMAPGVEVAGGGDSAVAVVMA